MNSAARSLGNSHVLITGGGTGIGAAIAIRLGASGAGITVAGRRREPLEEVARKLSNAHAVTLDVTDEVSVEEGVSAARERLGEVDVLVNNAGATASAPFARTKPEVWREMIEVNLTGTFFVSRAVLPEMVERGWGRIVNVASTAGLVGYPYIAAYAAAKHGVVGMTRSLALEIARTGVTANSVCPGYTETDLLSGAIENLVAKTGMDEEKAWASLLRANPQGRFVTPEEVAEAVAWLVGPNSGAMNGQSISISGGEVSSWGRAGRRPFLRGSFSGFGSGPSRSRTPSRKRFGRGCAGISTRRSRASMSWPRSTKLPTE